MNIIRPSSDGGAMDDWLRKEEKVQLMRFVL